MAFLGPSDACFWLPSPPCLCCDFSFSDGEAVAQVPPAVARCDPGAGIVLFMNAAGTFTALRDRLCDRSRGSNASRLPKICGTWMTCITSWVKRVSEAAPCSAAVTRSCLGIVRHRGLRRWERQGSIRRVPDTKGMKNESSSS